MKEILWENKYRPRNVEECILPDRIKDIFRSYAVNKEIPNMLLQGPPGVGKTSIAKALCDDVGCDYLFINGSSENGVDVIRNKFESYASTVSLSGGRKVIICDEGDRMSPQAQDALKTNIEKFSVNCSLIITSNHKNRIIDAIHSRCPEINFTLRSNEKPQMAQEMFHRILNILDLEGIKYSKPVIAEIIKKNFPDFRRITNRLQMLSRLGDIDVGVLGVGEGNLAELIRNLKDKDFNTIRKWIASNDIDYESVYHRIYDGLYDFMQPQSIPQAVLTIAEYQYKQALVVDKDINFMACLTELMTNCVFE